MHICIHLSVYLSVYLSAYLSIYLYTSVCVSTLFLPISRDSGSVNVSDFWHCLSAEKEKFRNGNLSVYAFAMTPLFLYFCYYYMRKAFKSLFKRLVIETHIGLLPSKRCRNMQSAPDTKHDLFSLLSDVNQALPKQLESFVDQLRNVCHQHQRASAVLCSVFPLGAHGEAGGNRSRQNFNGNRVAAMAAGQVMLGALETVTILHS